MKFAPLAAGLLLATAPSAALADDHAAEASVKAEAVATPTIDMPIEKLVADERSKAVLEKHLPGISTHPSYGQFKSMTLVQVQPWSMGLITDESIAAIKADLAEIK